MKRRRFLAAVGTGTRTAFAAGCVGRGPDAGAEPTDREFETATDDEPTDRVRDQETALAETTSVESNTTTNGGTPTESPTQSRTATETNGKGEGSTIQRRVSVANVEEVPERYQVDIDVELLESTVTAGHTARLRITTTNEGSRRKISIAEGKCGPFNRLSGLSETPGLILHRPSRTQWIDRAGNRWVRGSPGGRSARHRHVWLCKPSLCGWRVGRQPIPRLGRLPGRRLHDAWNLPLRGASADQTARRGVRSRTTTEFTWGFSLAVEKSQS